MKTFKLYHGNIATIPTRQQQAINNTINLLLAITTLTALAIAIINYIIQ